MVRCLPNSLAQRRKARQLILQALYQWSLTGADPSEISKEFHDRNNAKIDWAFLMRFSRHSQNSGHSRWTSTSLLDRKPEALDPIEKSLLYLGAYELANRIDVPYRVVINECVELAKVFGATESHKYINGVLDKLAPHCAPPNTAGGPERWAQRSGACYRTWPD